MSEIDSGSSAFPVTPTDNSGQIGPTEYGLTKREWFAGMALQGMMESDENVDPEFIGTHGKWADVVAKRAYGYADAMLREGDK